MTSQCDITEIHWLAKHTGTLRVSGGFEADGCDKLWSKQSWMSPSVLFEVFFAEWREGVRGGSICFFLFITSVNLYLRKRAGESSVFWHCVSFGFLVLVNGHCWLIESDVVYKINLQFVLISSLSTSLIFFSSFPFCSPWTDSPGLFINPSTTL